MTIQEVSRGAQAAELLDNPLLAEALAAFELEIIEQWKNSPARDQDGRERLWNMLQANRKFQQVLTTHIETGKLASVRPNRIERLRQVVGLT